MGTYDFGMIGLGTMGRNLLLNIADNGFAAIGFDRDTEKGQLLEKEATNGTTVKAASSLEEMVSLLKPPRRVMMLVPAGAIVDSVIDELLPLLSEGDIIIDGGNSLFSDTERRIEKLSHTKVHFVGMGVSGGEEGARRGPSIMPGGDIKAWKSLQPVLESIAAKAEGEPCVAYMGKKAAGHYVKMVHNGIEYAIMQLISETYDFLKRGVGLSNAELADVFAKWNEGELKSFLIEITADIFKQKDDATNNDLVDMILDKAGAKGTGKWTSQEAMNLGVAIPTIDTAVTARMLSSLKAERINAAALYKSTIKNISGAKEKLIAQAGDALFTGILVCYAQGLAMLQVASAEKQMDIPLKDVVKIWRGGCIIRSVLLQQFVRIFKKDATFSNILLDKKLASVVKKKQKALRKTVQQMAGANLPAAGLMSALAYTDAYVSERVPANLIQAQRDYFGAHTYQRIDKEGTFHTQWNKD